VFGVNAMNYAGTNTAVSELIVEKYVEGSDEEEEDDDGENEGNEDEEDGSEDSGDDKEDSGDDEEESGNDEEESGDDEEESGDDEEESGDDEEDSGDDEESDAIVIEFDIDMSSSWYKQKDLKNVDIDTFGLAIGDTITTTCPGDIKVSSSWGTITLQNCSYTTVGSTTVSVCDITGTGSWSNKLTMGMSVISPSSASKGTCKMQSGASEGDDTGSDDESDDEKDNDTDGDSDKDGDKDNEEENDEDNDSNGDSDGDVNNDGDEDNNSDDNSEDEDNEGDEDNRTKTTQVMMKRKRQPSALSSVPIGLDGKVTNGTLPMTTRTLN